MEVVSSYVLRYARADGKVNSETQTAENLYYRDINPQDATPARRDQTHGLTDDLPSTSTGGPTDDGKGGPSGQPKYLFTTAGELNAICEETDLTIAQVVWENELAFRSSTEIKRSLMESESLPKLITNKADPCSVGDDGSMYSKRSDVHRNPPTRWIERQKTGTTPLSSSSKRFLSDYRSRQLLSEGRGSTSGGDDVVSYWFGCEEWGKEEDRKEGSRAGGSS